MSCSKACAILLIIGFIISSVAQQNYSAEASADQTSSIRLPIGQETFKIELSETGVYDVTYTMLQSAGMDTGSVNPNSIEMMSAGESVAYEWIGDNDTTFEPGEKVRFFGVAYAGSRHNQQYVENNVYWLWADGTPTRINTLSNPRGYAPATYWVSREQFGDDLIFDFTDTNYDRGWAFVEAESWFWRMLRHNTTTAIPINLTHPVDVGIDAQYSIEIFSKQRVVGAVHQLQSQFNSTSAVTFSGTNAAEAMIHSGTLPASALADGANTFNLRPVTARGTDHMFLNEIIVSYTRNFDATNNELLFEYSHSGGVEFTVRNLSFADRDELIVWDVSDQTAPVAILVLDSDIAHGPSESIVRIGRNLSGASQLIVTTTDNANTPVSISEYVPVNLNPADGATWLAVSHNTLLTEIERLATHRAITNKITTHVVDVNDVINQYGHGLPIPDAIHTYVQEAYQTWSTPPRYLLLGGDASVNPRQRPCIDPSGLTCAFPWNTTDVNYVPTYLVHYDPFVGLIPSDHPYSLLEGDDLIPEISVGRLTVGNTDIDSTLNTTKTLAQQMSNLVDKIITYDTGVLTEADWTRRMAFLADDADAGGAFCLENEHAADLIPDAFTKTSFCYDEYKDLYPTGAINRLQADFFNEINVNSAAIVNYRGHGSVVDWGANIVTRNHRSSFANNGTPFVILSADCLDNHFTFNNLISLSEAFMRIENAGSAAHWGSTGLGFSWEHTILHNAFYEGLYERGASTIGDAIVHAKTVYEASPGNRSELFAFTLQGDPAMQMPGVTHQAFVPILMSPQVDIPKPYTPPAP